MFFSLAVSLEVQITPSQGEISLGESKFFMCEGKFMNPDVYAVFQVEKRKKEN